MANEYEDRMAECYSELHEHQNRIELLREPCRTAIIVATAVGIIDNGGFPYFFEMNFPDDPDYGMFIDAFRRVGFTEIADRFAHLVSRFPFDAPHAYPDRRSAYIDASPGDFQTAMRELEDLISATDVDAAVMGFFRDHHKAESGQPASNGPIAG